MGKIQTSYYDLLPSLIDWLMDWHEAYHLAQVGRELTVPFPPLSENGGLQACTTILGFLFFILNINTTNDYD